MDQLRWEVSTTTNTKEFLTQAVRDTQEWLRTREHPLSRDHWFGALELEDVTVKDGLGTFIWRDPADGVRHGWQYRCRTRGEMEAVDWRLIEEIATSEPTDPDEHGIRWWGVHQWVDGELVLNRGF